VLCIQSNLNSFSLGGNYSEICKFQIYYDWLNTFSSIRKLEFLNDFFRVRLKLAADNANLALGHYSYHELKMLANDYQNTKLKVKI
jgi:hypothetical protein